MARYYVPLPAFRAPPPLDFSGLNEGLDALGKHVEKNRLLAEQKELGEALRSGGQPSATSSAAPQYSAQPNRLLASPAQGSFAAAGREYGGTNPMDGYKRSIASIESAHEANPYQARGPVVQSGDRAFGKYQVMGANVGPWTKEILGREMSPEEFLASPEAQEKVFEGKFGQYASKHGPEGAASMWFTGRPSAPNARARGADGNPIGITGREYVSRFSGGTGQPEVSPPRPQAAPGGLNYAAGVDRALRQGNVNAAMELSNAQRQQENTAYERSRQTASDAQTSQLRDVQIQQGQQELQQAAQLKVASIAQAIENQADPVQRQAMWQKFVAVNPRIATSLQQYGVDPNDHVNGTAFLIAEARGLNPAKPTVHEVSGRLIQAQPDGTFKEVYQAPPKAKNLTVQEQKEVFEADEGVQAATNVVGALQKALALNDQAYSGPLAQTRGYTTSLFGSEGGNATEELQNVVLQQVLDNLKATFGAAPTEGERQILVDIQGSVNKAPEVRRRIFENAIAAANRRLQFNSTKANAIRGGEYFQPGYQPSAVQNTPAPQSAPQATPQQVQPVQVKTEQEYQALPAGTKYVAPDGSIRTKQ